MKTQPRSAPLHLAAALALATTLPLCSSVSAATPPTPVVDMNKPFNYAHPVLPRFYDATVLGARNTPPNDLVTDKGATLGRVLFYDKMLSVDNTIACADCHQQAKGFTDPKQFSTGVFGQEGSKHAMRIGNVAFYRGRSMFWDKRSPSLEDQATQPIKNPLEMGFSESNGGIQALIVKMQNSPYYPTLFSQVFGDARITEPRIQRALSQFERSMISAGSRWDQGYTKTYDPALPDKGLSRPIPTFTAQENAGLKLFMLPRNQGGAGCAGCHQPPTFALGPQSGSNGLDNGETTIFKSPSLKTITQGMPMMHDGRFTTFEQVVAHYNSGVSEGPALDNRLRDRNGIPQRLNLSNTQQGSLVAFLKTLQDPVLTTDKRFSNPFPRP